MTLPTSYPIHTILKFQSWEEIKKVYKIKLPSSCLLKNHSIFFGVFRHWLNWLVLLSSRIMYVNQVLERWSLNIDHKQWLFLSLGFLQIHYITTSNEKFQQFLYLRPEIIRIYQKCFCPYFSHVLKLIIFWYITRFIFSSIVIG